MTHHWMVLLLCIIRHVFPPFHNIC
ncbi:hypothetical protein AKJ16_DCAP19161, partial [Drosera capensis]